MVGGMAKIDGQSVMIIGTQKEELPKKDSAEDSG